jgi:O-antigen/teichoic acid export membrane protein
MGKSTKFTRDMIWVALSSIFTTALSIILLPILTKSYSATTYGIWTQVNVTNGLIIPVLMLAFDTAVITFLSGEKGNIEKRRSLGSMFSIILVFSFCVFPIIIIFARQLSDFIFNNPSYVTFVILTFIWTFVDTEYSFFISYLRARRKILKLSLIQAGMSLSHLIVIILFTSLGFGLEVILIWIIIIDLLFAVSTLFIITREEGFPLLNFTGAREFISFSVPSVPAGLLMWIIASSDRFFITHFLGLSQAGVYSCSDLLGGMIALFYTPIVYVLFPAISKAWEQNQKDDVKHYLEYSTKLFLALSIPATVGLTMLSQQILKIITTSEYLVGWQLVLLVSIGTIFFGLYQINVYSIYLVKKTKWIPVVAAICTIISAAINYFLVPRIGIIGGAISTVVSYFSLACIVFIWARKFINHGFNFVFIVKICLATIPMAIFLYFIKISGITRIILAIIGGTVIFAFFTFLLRVFTQPDKELIKQTITGLFPRKH